MASWIPLSVVVPSLLTNSLRLLSGREDAEKEAEGHQKNPRLGQAKGQPSPVCCISQGPTRGLSGALGAARDRQALGSAGVAGIGGPLSKGVEREEHCCINARWGDSG